MGAINLTEWQKLPITLKELCLNTTLRCGQSFRWRKNPSNGVWSCALHNRILCLHQDAEQLYYRSISPISSKSPLQAPPTPPSSHPPSECAGFVELESDDTLDLIKHYFNLTHNLSSLYTQWSASDPSFARKAPKFTGVRILRQDAWEALVGFICSSNNNILRIMQMVNKLCVHYGPYLGDFEGESYHDFPSPQALAKDGVEAQLRALGFGYRAKYLHNTARIILEKEEGWLDSLRNPSAPSFRSPLPSADSDEETWSPQGRPGYRTAHSSLLTLSGVGPKVADCVCLMGLGWGEAVPVDTHVWQIAQRDYKFAKGKNVSLTKALYDAVGDKFRGIWGREAGWAHSVLFTADLRVFAEGVVEVAVKDEEESVVGVKREDEEENQEVKRVRVKVEEVRQRKRRRRN